MPDSMLAVVKEKPKKGISIKRIPIPKPKKGEVLIRVLYASICGTDIGIYDWTPWAAGHIKPPIVIGHEVVGRVIRVIPDPDQESNHMDSRFRENDIKVGDIVSSETHIFCGKCYQCKIGNHNICENMQLFGIGRNGGFAEYATIPLRTTWKNPSTGSGQARSIPIKAMSVQEPLGNAVHVVTKANIKGKRVLIVGLGPTGLCAGMAARALGAKEIVGLNRTNYRRKLAKNIGFDKVLPRLPKKYFDAFDAVFEMSGSQSGIQTAFDAVRIAGTLIAFGIPKRQVEIDWGKYLINKELTIKSVFGRRIWETWKQTSKLLTSGKIDLQKIITHEFDLVDFESAMKIMKSGKCGKIVLRINA